jgi:hypothetical protein
MIYGYMEFQRMRKIELGTESEKDRVRYRE